ncbi:short chain dehydrogenase domain-containing protein [Sarocladium implicatum]|nr:short chain dehydrogenase domain-containing protein [Sarocladium implicatum]
MASAAKTIVATGVSSGIGLEAIKQLLQQPQPYRVILGARNIKATEEAYGGITYDKSAHNVSILPLELSNLRDVKRFASETLEKLGKERIDYLLLNAAISNGSEQPGPHGSKWSEPLIVNHFSQHYLTHLLREKLVESQSRVVIVSSGAVNMVKDSSNLDHDLKGAAGATSMKVYSGTKFVQLLGAHWWRRELSGTNTVVAVSPGMIPGSGLYRGSGQRMPSNSPDAKSVPQGAASILAAFTRSDFPEDSERMFLTSWGEWWSKDVFPPDVFNKELQEKWSPSKEQLEKEENILD